MKALVKAVQNGYALTFSSKLIGFIDKQRCSFEYDPKHHSI